VDWASDETERIVHSLRDRDHRINIVTVLPTQLKYNLAVAYNLAARFITTTKMLKVDCDSIVSHDILTKHILKSDINEQKNVFFRGNWRLAQNMEDRHTNGVLLLPTELFLNVGGYDERFAEYGYEDSELYNRLLFNGAQMKDLHPQCVRHLHHSHTQRNWHSHSLRIKSAEVQVQINRVLSEKVSEVYGKWNSSTGSEFVFRYDNDELYAYLHSLPKSFNDLVSIDELHQTQLTQIKSLLKSRLSLSSSVLNGMNEQELFDSSALIDFIPILGSTEQRANLVIVHLRGNWQLRLLNLENLMSAVSQWNIKERRKKRVLLVWEPVECPPFDRLLKGEEEFTVIESIEMKSVHAKKFDQIFINSTHVSIMNLAGEYMLDEMSEIQLCKYANRSLYIDTAIPLHFTLCDQTSVERAVSDYASQTEWSLSDLWSARTIENTFDSVDESSVFLLLDEWNSLTFNVLFTAIEQAKSIHSDNRLLYIIHFNLNIDQLLNIQQNIQFYNLTLRLIPSIECRQTDSVKSNLFISQNSDSNFDFNCFESEFYGILISRQAQYFHTNSAENSVNYRLIKRIKFKTHE